MNESEGRSAVETALRNLRESALDALRIAARQDTEHGLASVPVATSCIVRAVTTAQDSVDAVVDRLLTDATVLSPAEGGA